MDGLLEEDLTYRIRGCVYEVARHLGGGFLEKVYENALLNEMRRQGIIAEAQVPVSVHYKGVVVGQYIADLLIEGKVLLELKVVRQTLPEHEAQVLNYLKATGLRVGLLVNFSHPKATIKRLVL